ncbi:SgrR family transcriptional regulator [Franconibacter sp. IITDAS19]|uniref:SgrR family transcriptional regulator n=1 Tax=Franconibacter sp. IITDAS19 TaxID=2930569 RepID=UPI001FFA1F00|nr:SgrR family transcriptional regulator [Franconibacter sp. IITDAS19]MCK1967059.1 SgrR family transcriptional regulator [Franconibacter sp. IITDAS19]
MRLLNRLNQFQRLWQPSAGSPQQTTVAELAARCFCSERHARSLLRQLEEAGWLTWQAQSGRGKRGTLTFLVSPQSVRAGMMEKVLRLGEHHNALALAQLAPEQLRHLLTPFLGGQWQNDTPTLRIPYYRPLEPLTPGFLPGRAEQHLASQIFAGLTRFEAASLRPHGDLAHHWEVSPDGLTWRFYLRSTLHWHDGKPVETAQLLTSFTHLLTQPALRQLFSSVKTVDSPHARCLRFTLFRPDYWLPWRLASYCSFLAHPDDNQTGCGPFRLTAFTPELVRLESHEFYHLQHPLLKAVEYWITPQLFDRALGTSCRHPVQIALGQEEELAHLRPVSNSISLGFCYLGVRQAGRLSIAQARRLISLIHQSGMIDALPLDEGLITPSREMLPGWELPQWPPQSVQLPPRLTLFYHLPVELHVMAQQLREQLASLGCELTLHFHDAKNWDGCGELGKADMVMGDRLIGEAPEYTLEQWLRCDALWPNLLTLAQQQHLFATLDSVQRYPDDETRNAALKAVFYEMMSAGIITPLFNYRYQISAPPGINGVELNARGWFDFTRAWLPPPEQGKEAG